MTFTELAHAAPALYVLFVACLAGALAGWALVASMPGGLPRPRPDQGYAPTNPPMAPGSTAVVRARLVIVSGQGEGVYSYSPSPGAGNLIATAGIAMAGVDGYNNNVLPGNSTYSGSFATSLNAGFINFYTGSLAGGWTFQANIEISLAGELILQAANALVSDNLEVGTNLQVDAAATIGTTLTVNGSTISGPSVTSLSIPSATIDVHNGNVNLNMASPPNYPTSGKTLAQTQACLDGLIGSMVNRQLVA